MIKYFYADSLKAYFECIREIEEVVIGRKNVSGNYFSVEKPPILWVLLNNLVTKRREAL